MVKRVISIICIVILGGLYIATFVCALLATPAAKNMFMGSLILTVLVPIFMWIFMALYKRAHMDDDRNISMAEMRKYRKRMKQGEDPEKIAKEIEEKYETNKMIQEDK